MAKKDSERLRLGKINYLLLIISAVLLIVGYVIMSFQEITISPLILILVYVIIIPIAILLPPRKK